MRNRCNECVVKDKNKCLQCRENPIYANVPTVSLFKAYNSVCPRGYDNCVCDPTYILYHSPKWYSKLYDTTTPEQAIFAEGSCMDRYKDDPNEEGYCYDDGD